MGLLDNLSEFIKTPEGQGLLAGSFGGMAAARKGQPWNTAGAAGLAGLMGYSRAGELQDRQAENAVRNQVRQMQIKQVEEAIADKQKTREGTQRFIESVDPMKPVLANGQGPTVANSANLPDAKTQQYYDMLKNGLIGPMEYIKATGPKDTKVKDYREIRHPDGSVEIIGLTEDGKVVNTKQQPFIKPEVRDAGGKIIGIDLITGKSQDYANKTMTPDAVAANNLGWANNAVSRERLNFDKSQTPPATTKNAPSGYKWTETGDLVAIPGGPADAKVQAAAKQKMDGASDVDIAIGTLRDAYDRLEKGGGITSTGNSGISNVFPSIASSGIGQTAGKLFGTDNQSARNDIAMTRPALLAALMKATGMSAKQMDSNAELKMWMTTATDPTLDVESNRRALDKIEKKYLRGQGEQQPTEAPSAPVRKYNPKTGRIE